MRFSADEVRARTQAFHEVYYYARLWESTHWLGVPAWKCPLDLWIMQEVIAETRPDVIVECGSAMGGSATYFASLFRLLGHGRVISIDIKSPSGLPHDDRVTFLQASSIDPATLEQVRSMIAPGERVMLVLDSLHNRDHVLAELKLWSGLVSPGCYCIVEDTNINGHPVYTDYEPDAGPGAFEAVEEFVSGTDRFVVDPSREKLLLTFNPRGYLRCVAPSALLTGTGQPLELASPAAQPKPDDLAARVEQLHAEMDAAKRLAVERYETIRALSASLSEQVGLVTTLRETVHAPLLDRVRWLERQVESGERRTRALSADHAEAIQSLQASMAEVIRSRAAITEMLDARGLRLKSVMNERDALVSERDQLRAQVRDLSAMLAMARSHASRLEEQCMHNANSNSESERRLRDLETDLETLLTRVEHLERLEQSRRDAVEPARTGPRLWPRRTPRDQAAKS